jgi:hypothetical protein
MIVSVLIVHLMLGYRCFRGMEYYWDNPMVILFLGLQKVPEVSTVKKQSKESIKLGLLSPMSAATSLR